MNSFELILAISVVLFVMFALGWIARWYQVRLANMRAHGSPESELEVRLREMAAERDEAVTNMQVAEEECANRLRQVEADLEAAMDALGDARREADYYREAHARTAGTG